MCEPLLHAGSWLSPAGKACRGTRFTVIHGHALASHACMDILHYLRLFLLTCPVSAVMMSLAFGPLYQEMTTFQRISVILSYRRGSSVSASVALKRAAMSAPFRPRHVAARTPLRLLPKGAPGSENAQATQQLYSSAGIRNQSSGFSCSYDLQVAKVVVVSEASRSDLRHARGRMLGHGLPL